MRLTFALRDAAAVQVVLGRKDAEFKAGVRTIVRAHAQEAHAVAFSLCPVRSGFMQRQIRLQFTPAGFGWSLGWIAADFRRTGKPFYPPFLELGTSRMRAQPSIQPAFRQVGPMFQRELIAFVRQVASRRAS